METFSVAKAKTFISGLELEEPSIKFFTRSDDQRAGYVNDGSLVSFVEGLSKKKQQDVLNSTLLAQLAANRKHDRENDTVKWYKFYREVLENVGWVIQDFGFSKFNAGGSEFSVDKVVLDVLAAIATGNEMAIVTETINAVKNLSDGDNRLVLFERASHSLKKGNFQISVASESGGVILMKIGAFYFSTTENVTKVLWFRFSSQTADMYKGNQTINLNMDVYDEVRDDIIDKLGDKAERFVKQLDIG